MQLERCVQNHGRGAVVVVVVVEAHHAMGEGERLEEATLTQAIVVMYVESAGTTRMTVQDQHEGVEVGVVVVVAVVDAGAGRTLAQDPGHHVAAVVVAATVVASAGRGTARETALPSAAVPETRCLQRC